jgi:hypothetical protein
MEKNKNSKTVRRRSFSAALLESNGSNHSRKSSLSWSISGM